MIEKAPSRGADMVILDLEDAVAPAAKSDARGVVVDGVTRHDWGETVLFVRINDWTSPWTLDDLTEVCGRAGSRLDGVVLPKTEHPSHVAALDLVLTQIERRVGLDVGHYGVEVQIEGPVGLGNVDAICAASDRLEAIILGPVDFAAAMGMPSHHDDTDDPMFPSGLLYHAEMSVLVAGRAHGLQVIDGPYVDISDPDGLRRSVERARRMGFDGKWVLHPDQIEPTNHVLSPSQEQFDAAVRHVTHLRRLVDEGVGAGLLDGEMVDEATGRVAETIVRRGRAAGMTASGERSAD